MTNDQRPSTIALIVAAFIVLLSAMAQAQTVTRCAECHFANMSAVPSPAYLGEWTRSAHARHNVGCEQCHGGDPSTYQATAAHRGILGRDDPRSPIHPDNVAQTCGVCHRAIAAAYERSRHEAALIAADRQAPSCTACHGAMRARRPAAATIENRCTRCHAPGSAPADEAGLIGASVERVEALRLRCERLDRAVEQVRDMRQRIELRLAVSAARYTLTEAATRVHSFNARQIDERTTAARAQLDAIADALVGR